jgi:hypothetical protein
MAAADCMGKNTSKASRMREVIFTVCFMVTLLEKPWYIS